MGSPEGSRVAQDVGAEWMKMDLGKKEDANLGGFGMCRDFPHYDFFMRGGVRRVNLFA